MPKPQNTDARAAAIRAATEAELARLGLAAGATIDGLARYRAASTIADDAGCDVSTAKRHIDAVLTGKELTKRGGARKGTGPKPKTLTKISQDTA